MAAMYKHCNAGISTLWKMHSCQTCGHGKVINIVRKHVKPHAKVRSRSIKICNAQVYTYTYKNACIHVYSDKEIITQELFHSIM